MFCTVVPPQKIVSSVLFNMFSSHQTHSSPANAFQCQILTEEIDLEIALRERLAATLDFRVVWALILQDSLANDAVTTGQFSVLPLFIGRSIH